jgi:L-alanine-DL-glutamate epimerase-like enolase superfamily enzyme
MDIRGVEGHLLSIPVDFHIALGRIRFSHHVVIHLCADGLTGIGAGVLYRTPPYQVGQLLDRVVRPAIKAGVVSEASPEEQAEWIAKLAALSPALAYAVDSALWDLQGKQRGERVVDLLGGPQQERIPITEQIFIRDWSSAARELEAIIARGCTRLKLKIGVNPAIDLETVRRVRAMVGPEMEIRVDANRAYSLEEGAPLYSALADLGILALEEPLAGRNWAALRALRRRLGLPVILDENVLSLDDLDQAIGEESIDILNIKLTRVGGISQALRYVAICQAHGVQTAVGCTEDLGIGMAAILHTAAALPVVHSVEGIGPLRLGFDVIDERWPVQAGTLGLPEAPGLGVALPDEWRRRLPHDVRCYALPGGRSLRAFSVYAHWFQRANNALWRLQRKGR